MKERLTPELEVQIAGALLREFSAEYRTGNLRSARIFSNPLGRCPSTRLRGSAPSEPRPNRLRPQAGKTGAGAARCVGAGPPALT